MVALKQFYLDETLDWEIYIHRQWNSYANKDIISDDDLVELLKGGGHCASFSSDDAPEFKALRNQLEADGYIRCERMWWNGDRVLRAFQLNGVTFRKHDQFCCGSAMKHHLSFTRKHSDK
jgi:hypothetical protein